MIKLSQILEKIIINKKGELVNERWAIFIDSLEDWEILSNILKKKGYKFLSGYTYSKYDLINFNPFKSERDFGDEGDDDNDLGYSFAMSYHGMNDFVLVSMPNKKLVIINSNYFNSRKNSTYKQYEVFHNLKDLIENI